MLKSPSIITKTDVTGLTKEQKTEKAKNELQSLLEEYVGRGLIKDKCTNGEYKEIPEFTAKFNEIY